MAAGFGDLNDDVQYLILGYVSAATPALIGHTCTLNSLLFLHNVRLTSSRLKDSSDAVAHRYLFGSIIESMNRSRTGWLNG